MAKLDDCVLPLDIRQLVSYEESSISAVFAAMGIAVIVLVTVLVVSGSPLCNLSRGRIEAFWWVSDMNNRLSPLNACHSYGLFATMTTFRHELVFQGSSDGVSWESFELPWKPGHSADAAPAVVPLGHMPRLDWRLWFLPLNNSKPSWLQQVCRQLLKGSPSVFGLFYKTGSYTPSSPPRFVRIVKYAYVFSKPSGVLAKLFGNGGRDSEIAESPSHYWHR